MPFLNASFVRFLGLLTLYPVSDGPQLSLLGNILLNHITLPNPAPSSQTPRTKPQTPPGEARCCENAWLLPDNGAFDFVPPRTQDLCVKELTESRKLAPIPPITSINRRFLYHPPQHPLMNVTIAESTREVTY